LKGVAPPGVEIVDLYKAVVPFVAIIILACILMSIFPSLITGLPSMMVGY
ncbi:MAG: C4-dicarboxylate ABC transporter, partial [Pseudomonadota bacterium]|nr:C4-dicarboxylate ABC transporter [Pseudomonadota bacterium]